MNLFVKRWIRDLSVPSLLSFCIRKGDIHDPHQILLCDFAILVLVDLHDLLSECPNWYEHPPGALELIYQLLWD